MLFNMQQAVIWFKFDNSVKYDKQDQKGNERNPHMTKQQEPVAKTPNKNRTGQRQSTDRSITK
jgi:hypothetical protein